MLATLRPTQALALVSRRRSASLIKAEMVAEMDARKADALTAGSYTLRYIAYESSRVDTKALKAAGLYDQYSSKQTALRFSVQ